MSTWYLQSNGESVGPLDGKGMEALVASGRLRPGSLICRVGASEWSRADSDPFLAGLFTTPGAAPPGPGWDIFGAAKYHRLFLFCLPLLIVANCAGNFWAVVEYGRPRDPGLMLVLVAFLAVCLAIYALLITLNVRLQIALRTHAAVIVIQSFLLLAPCIGLVTMLVISQSLQKRFTALGISVGFMGVKRAQLIEAGFVPPER